MSILKSVYAICKEIRNLPFREEVRSLINDLTYTNHEKQNSGLSRDTFGYIARQRTLQFFSYLLTNNQREIFQSIPHPMQIGSLSNEEILLFEKAHYFLISINRLCSQVLLDIAPNTELSINPYGQFDYKFLNTFSEELTDNLESMSKIIAEFAGHPSINIIKSGIKHIPQVSKISKIDLQKNILGLSKHISSAELTKVPSDLSEMSLRFGKKSGFYQMSIFLFAILSFKVSLMLMNQLIFKSFLFDKLPVLDNDNVFNIKEHLTNMLGEVLIVESQPSHENIFSHPGDLILVKLNEGDHRIDSLFLIHKSNLSLMGEFGDMQEFGLRRVDENLNYYFGLLRNF